ncbi:MAG: response regulator transcription factor [Myxococcales bacterium]|nr:response regulator transcription factor [Myxococcales bacterium]
MNTPIQVLLADDHAVLRQGLALLLNQQPNIHVVGEAQSGREAVDLARQMRPDVVIMDLTMPELGGIEAIERITKECPRTRVIALTMHDEIEYMRAVVAAGGAGFIPKGAAHTELVSAVRAVADGAVHFAVSLPGGELQHFSLDDVHLPPADKKPLSRREHEVLLGVAQGFSAKEIAAQLEVGTKTVESYRRRIAEKLGLKNRADIVRYALEKGLLRGA